MKNRFSICSSLLVLVLTILVSASAQAQAYNPLRITGPVTSYNPADCAKSGSITIAGITIPIAAGAEVSFINSVRTVNASGFIVDVNRRSETWQIVPHPANPQGSVRNLAVYLDPQGRIRLQPSPGFFTFATAQNNFFSTTFNLLPVAASASRTLEFTGTVSAVDANSFTINGLPFLTFQLAPGTTLPVGADENQIVHIRAALNASNQVTGPVTLFDTYQALSASLAPTSFGSVGVGAFADVNPGDGDGPIAAPVDPGFLFLCDQSVERLVLEGLSALYFAPNFTMRQQISVHQRGDFAFQRDQFGWVALGNKL